MMYVSFKIENCGRYVHSQLGCVSHWCGHSNAETFISLVCIGDKVSGGMVMGLCVSSLFVK